MNDSALILFTLPPEAEAPRKRLGGTARTRRIVTALLRHVDSACRDVPGLDLLVAAPGGRLPIGGRRLPQRGRDFGESLRLAFEDAFALGYRRVLVVGNDAPEISAAYLQTALARLDREGAAVLGPATDGGYVLLGLSRPCADAFRDIPFGGPGVADATRARLRAAGLSVSSLAALTDIDDAASLQRVLRRIKTRPRFEALRRLYWLLAFLLAPARKYRRQDLPWRGPAPGSGTVGLRAPPVAA